jgi:hypothetical protein
LREWVDDFESTPDDLDLLTKKDEKIWKEEIQDFLLY